jgi:hypothetical protein
MMTMHEWDLRGQVAYWLAFGLILQWEERDWHGLMD